MGKSKSTIRSKYCFKAPEYICSFSVFFFAFLFAFWTVSSHAATFFNIPWETLSGGIVPLGLIVTLFFYKISKTLSDAYCEIVRQIPLGVVTPHIVIFTIIFAAAILLCLTTLYWIKYIIILTGFGAVAFLSKKNMRGPVVQVKNTFEFNNIINLFILFFLLIAAVVFTIWANRPDLDDSSFIQIAVQTLFTPHLPPLSHDISLGVTLDLFRFAPYRICSYETLVALLSDWSDIPIIYIYYIFLPAFTAGLSVMVTFMFCRCFLHSTFLALIATAVFLLLMLAWGETHYAYGNRVFVRLFQGKGLLISLTTPFVLICGRLLMNRPNVINFTALTVANICAIGVSSSGLVVTLFTTLLVGFWALGKDYKKTLRLLLLTAGTLVYPILLGVWLKLQSATGAPLSTIGSSLPINSSLGLNIRETVALLSLLLGFSYSLSNKNKTGILLFSTVPLVIFNPWFSELIADLTSKNMNWRLAWAAPVPLLVAIGWIYGISSCIENKKLVVNKNTITGALVSLCLAITFLLSDNWVSDPSNMFSWGKPTPKLPAEYYYTCDFIDKIQEMDIHGAILANEDIAAWIPAIAPGMKLVMPGHTYPIQLQTVLPPHEFKSRMQLYKAVHKESQYLYNNVKLLRAYDVQVLIIPSRSHFFDNTTKNKDKTKISFLPVCTLHGYSIFRVIYA